MKRKFFLIFLILAMISCSGENSEKKIKTIEKKKIVKRENTLTVPVQNVASSASQRGDYNINYIKVTANVYRKKTRKLYWDNDQKPDIYGLIEFPSGDALAFPLKRNSFINTAYGENLTLDKGDTVRIVLRDKDISGSDEIANGKFVYNGRTKFKKKIGNATFTFVIKKRKNK